jgi:hypothetical protein
MKIHYGGHKSPVIGHEADESYPNPKNWFGIYLILILVLTGDLIFLYRFPGNILYAFLIGFDEYYISRQLHSSWRLQYQYFVCNMNYESPLYPFLHCAVSLSM